MKNTDKIYILGGAMWLISDLLSDPAIMQTLRGGALESVSKRLKELMPELKLVANASLSASKLAEQSARYEKKLIQGIEKHIKADDGIENKDAEIQAVIDQFALSSEYLHEWLRVLFVVPANKQSIVNDAIEEIIQANGNVKTRLQLAIEWVQKQGDEIDKNDLINKLIFIQNA